VRRVFFFWWCRWQQKGLDPKYYHTEPDGSNWVYSYASQSLLSAGLPAHSAYEAAPWELDPSYLSQGIPRYLPPHLLCLRALLHHGQGRVLMLSRH
jgi:hypothetical protein